MDYKDLTDYELFQAVKMAKDISTINGTPFAIAIEATLDVMVEERKQREKEILNENPLYVQSVDKVSKKDKSWFNKKKLD